MCELLCVYQAGCFQSGWMVRGGDRGTEGLLEIEGEAGGLPDGRLCWLLVSARVEASLR